MQGPTYMHIIFIQQVHTTVLHNPQLVEFIDGKPWIQKANYLHVNFLLCSGGWHPLTSMLLKGQLSLPRVGFLGKKYNMIKTLEA